MLQTEKRGMRQRPRCLIVVFLLGALFLGGCTRGATTAGETPSATGASTGTVALCPEAIRWDQAGQYVGRSRTVEGPVISTHFASSGNKQPTFLNVGRDYPDPTRFTVLIWGEDRSNFTTVPETAYAGKEICVTGIIQTYKGVPVIIVSYPSVIDVVG
jgi:hypothetical protein